MRREQSPEIEAAGQDSFLDVTTNIVGILIILVVVVGLRAKNSPKEVGQSNEVLQAAMADLSRQTASIQYDIVRLSQETEQVQQETAARMQQCTVLATAIAAAEKEISDRRSQLDVAEKEDFDLQRQLADARSAVDLKQAEIQQVSAQKTTVQEVKHYPTPISRTVFGRELHYELREGKVAYVPIDQFLEDVRSNLRSIGSNISEISDKVHIVGPRNGFEFRYTMDVVADRTRGLVGIRTREFQVVPVGMSQGETAERALSPQSKFRAAMALHSSADTTITLWTYPDSFELYRQLKDELHRLGYATAGRPLPHGVLIGGSDRGSKSAAQ